MQLQWTRPRSPDQGLPGVRVEPHYPYHYAYPCSRHYSLPLTLALTLTLPVTLPLTLPPTLMLHVTLPEGALEVGRPQFEPATQWGQG